MDYSLHQRQMKPRSVENTSIPYLPICYCFKMLAVGGLSICCSAFSEAVFVDEAVDIGDFFRSGDDNALAGLDGFDEVGCFEETAYCSCV